MKATLLTLLPYLIVSLNAIYAQEARPTNVPGKTTSRTPIPEGPSVTGEFHGRFPCAEIAKDWKVAIAPGQWKMKWALTLYQDPATGQPTTYRLRGTLNRAATREGTWAIVTGTPTDPTAIVYQLDADKPNVSVYLLKGDDDVLFILDQQRHFRIGTADLSYTLNRVVN
ncbi:hypothetical protein [Spirosoma sordidisoli]|uniref:Copper resistance protein NlpE n=1 Tax=Spirosoma sordidisoli TaxID=2502893 RepID=A0A4Q2USD8_9BACT|nr:hypothetical protein [Spirosoma sordidisoli]RYC71982.1 hypothetical protein EQG79_07630 [Spirosoma sordidisoli]